MAYNEAMSRFFLLLLVFVPVTIVAQIMHMPSVWLFAFSALAIIPLAKYIGESTEELSIYAGPAVGGLLNATFGNATELIIGILALQAGLIDVVKASLVGSILSNLLLVLGTAIIAGGWGKKQQTFNATAAKAAGSTLLLAVIALVIPPIFLQTSGTIDPGVIETLSLIVSALLIVGYSASLLFSLYTHKHLYVEEVGVGQAEEKARWSVGKSLLILVLATLAVAYMSEILVGSIEPLVRAFGWTELFIGVVFIAIIGNAAEHVSAIRVALKDKMDLTLQVSMGSATQIAMFVAPVLVLVSYFFANRMDLVFNTFELVALIFSVFIVNAIIEDGESNWLEGVQLLIAYLIIATAFYFHP